MKKNQLFDVLMLLALSQSPITMLSKESLNLDALDQLTKNFTINVHWADLDNIDFNGASEKIAKNIGQATKEIIKEAGSSLAEGLAEMGTNGNFGKNLEKGLTGATRQATHAFKNTMEDPNLKNNIIQGADAWASRVGDAAQSTQQGLAREVWPAMGKMSYQGIASIFNMKNAFQIGYPFAVISIVSLTGYYGTRIAWKVLEKNLLDPRPTILLPGSKYGRWDRISRWRSSYQSPAMIFDEQVKARLIEIEEKTKNIREHIRHGKKATYDNLLLYGKPGTGKTLFAQILADKSDMDFLPVTAGSLLQSGIEGIKYINELIDMANRSKYGTIIFIDEADALFVDRDSLDPASDHYKVLNHLLALTGNGSNKFMIIAATNHAYVMDEAMGRRFQDRVLMPLPNAITRKELLDLYLNIVMFNEKNNSKEFVTIAKKLLTPACINSIVEQTEGLSHAEIKDAIHAMHKKALATKTGIIITTHIDSAIKQAIEKHQALEADKLEREQHQK